MGLIEFHVEGVIDKFFIEKCLIPFFGEDFFKEYEIWIYKKDYVRIKS